MRPRDRRENVKKNPPFLDSKPLVKIKLGIQRLVVILPIEEQDVQEQLNEDDDTDPNTNTLSPGIVCEQEVGNEDVSVPDDNIYDVYGFESSEVDEAKARQVKLQEALKFADSSSDDVDFHKPG